MVGVPDSPSPSARLAGLRAPETLISVAAALVFLAIFAIRFRRILLSPYLISDDALQQIFPFYAAGTPLEALSPSARYYLDLFPPGFSALYRAASAVGLDLLLFSKGVTAFAFLLTLALAYALGCVLGRALGGLLLLGVTFCCLGFFLTAAGGLPRAFGFPVALLVAISFAAPSARAAGLASLVSLLFYPAIAPLAVGSLLLLLALPRALGLEELAQAGLRRRLVLGTAAVAVTAVFYGAHLLGRVEWGAQLGGAELAALPEMQPGGRYEPLDSFPLPKLRDVARVTLDGVFSLSSPAGRSSLGGASMWLLLVGLVPCLWPRRRESRACLVLCLVLLFYFPAAELLYPRLYLPTRSVTYLLPALVLVAAAMGAGRLQALLPASATRVLLVAVAAAGVALAPSFRNGFNYDFEALQPLYRVLRGTPSDTVIAGLPSPVVDGAQLFGRRAVLAGHETYQVFHRGYLELMRERWVDNLRILFSGDPGELASLVGRYRIRYLIVPESIYRDGCSALRLFRPYTGIARRLCWASRGPLARSFPTVWEGNGQRLLRVETGVHGNAR